MALISSAQRWRSNFIDVGDTNFVGFVVILLCHRKNKSSCIKIVGLFKINPICPSRLLGE